LQVSQKGMVINMNQGFFSLPEDKQRNIINMGFQVFSQSSYKKAPVAEIAAKAGISKALLFYHFKNKKELYLFLWEKSIELTSAAMKEQDVLGTNNYFEMLRRSLLGKCNLLREYPYVSEFSLRAYYEENIEVKKEIQDSFQQLNQSSEIKAFEVIDIGRLRDDIDIHQMYQEMVWASDGYLHRAFMQGDINVDKLKSDFEKLILMWEKVYQK
jgi:TetR/AcrR family transcriptional regulator